MCGCGNTSTTSASKSWKVRKPDGSTKKFSREADARLAAAKSGGKVLAPSS